tara:strand:+ start:695 stop:934 length:240 start_codon:yes stop_codon:yes gene_type:complete
MSSSLKGLPRVTIASSGYHSYSKNDQLIQAKTINKKLDMKVLVMSLFLISSFFLIVPESPQTSSTICDKYYSERICSVW